MKDYVTKKDLDESLKDFRREIYKMFDEQNRVITDMFSNLLQYMDNRFDRLERRLDRKDVEDSERDARLDRLEYWQDRFRKLASDKT